MTKIPSFGEGKDIAVIRAWHTLTKIDHETHTRERVEADLINCVLNPNIEEILDYSELPHRIIRGIVRFGNGGAIWTWV